MKALQYRMWLLRKYWGQNGWTMIPTPTAKMTAAKDKLVRDGLLEVDPYDSGMLRITEAGLLALEGGTDDRR